jgi:hypothetical protein
MYTEEQQKIINNLQQLAKDLNKNISSTDYRNSEIKPSIDRIIKLFGSWNDALVAANLPVHSKITDEHLIYILQDYYKTHNKVPTQSTFKNNPRYPNASTFQRRFGSWNKALESAGLPVKRAVRKYTKESIITYIQKFYNSYGRPPKYDDFNNNPDFPHADTVKEHFGSWKKGIEAAGYYTYDNIKYSKESIISSIQQFYVEIGRVPQRRDFLGNPKYPGYTVVSKHFGSWNAAVEAAGFTPHISDLYGVATRGLDGHKYRSRAEAYFADNYLYDKYEYEIEPSYPKPYSYFYDWYIPSLDLYIELTAGLHPERITDKIKLNKLLNRNCLVININDIYKKDFKL